MTYRRVLSTLTVLALLAAACGSDDASDTVTTPPGSTAPTTPTSTPVDAPDGFEEIRLDIERVPAAPSPESVEAVVLGDAALGLDVLSEIAGDDNVMISPYSIASALSMLYAGAGGNTAAEIGDVLHLEVSDAELHEVRNLIDIALTAEPPAPTEDDTRAPFQLRPANSVWGQRDYPFSDDYLTVLASYYGAGLRVLDFAVDPETSRSTINDWVERTTEERIRDLIPEGAIDPLTRLVLVNAIWFKANWAEQFEEEATTDGVFNRPDGSTVTVPFLRGEQPVAYAAGDGYTAVRLPFAGDAAMVFVLPDDGLTPLDAALQIGPALAPAWEPRSVDLSIPKFEYESDVGLAAVLRSLGMIEAFDPFTADLDAITGSSNDLHVSDALHKSFISVDETGAEAAAATAIIVRATSAGPEPAVFTADRPFLFWIEHSPTGEPLFLGQVTDPSA